MPVRRIPPLGSQKNIGKFPSIKMGRVAWYESLLERDYMYRLDRDTEVQYWEEQPLKIRFVHDGKTHHYTPDFEVHRNSKKQIVEVKPQKKVDSGEWDLLFSVASSICEREGYEFVVITDKMIRMQPELDNVKKLWKYARTPLLPQYQILCKRFFCCNQSSEINLGELLSYFQAEKIPAEVVYALIFFGALNIDMMQPINSNSLIRMPLAKAASAATRKDS
jgi:hypothetical protein